LVRALDPASSGPIILVRFIEAQEVTRLARACAPSPGLVKQKTTRPNVRLCQAGRVLFGNEGDL